MKVKNEKLEQVLVITGIGIFFLIISFVALVLNDDSTCTPTNQERIMSDAPDCSPQENDY